MNTVQIKEEQVQRVDETEALLIKVKVEENGNEQQHGAQTVTTEMDGEFLAIGDHLPAESSPSKNGVVIRPNRNGKQKGARWERQKWLQNRVPYTYTELIAMAINTQPDQRATLAEIYEYLRINYDCFRGPYTGWKNCIRHTLTLAKSFHKVPRAERAGRVGLGNYWALSDYFHRRSMAGGLGRRSRKAHTQEAFNAVGEETNLRPKETTKPTAKGNAKDKNDGANHWEQQQSNDVEDLLRRIGIPPRANISVREQQKYGDKDNANAEQRLRQLTTALSEANPIAAIETGQNKANRNGGGNKLDLLLAKMGHLRSAKCPPTSALSPHSLVPSSSSAAHFHDNSPLCDQPLSPRHHPMAALQRDHLLSHPFSSLPSSFFKPVPSPMGVQQQIQRHQQHKRNDAEEEVITVEEDDNAEMEKKRQQNRQGIEGGQQQQLPFCHQLSPHSVADGPSVAVVAQVSAWLGLVAGEMRLRLQCDGKNGSMVLSPNCQGRAVHRLQFVPGNDRELVIRQFAGDQFYQEKRWTWHDNQEEQTLHAIRGICFHFFFCR